ncbi:flagellin N-terminal helical domain-containing protein [Paenibacillus sp. IHBB 10380]|uniref:flagellin N-terminal helical domain-containing protein n=1 Tax=Paenibacillus sp. IHBB 10380 TaxID=1566358 RepID=UPI0005CFB100|nr:flagellin [Paenibacillus sp. IHBB 10380]AJS60371.1 flagellin [Paenibacillus sp. IHBB 10380]
MIINHNIAAMNTHRQLGTNTTNTNKAIEKLSSGLRINRAGDDAAGLAISEKMRGQIRGLDMATKNAQDGISLIQTAEGALNETHSILQRIRELSVQSSNDTNTDDDRKELQKEVTELTAEITRISTDTEFNTKKLLDGAGVKSSVFHIGANTNQNIKLTIENMGAVSLGISSVAIGSQTAANAAIKTLDAALTKVSAERSKLGANQNRLEHTINNLGTTSENLSAAESRVRDVDMAKEMMNQTKNNILAQAAQAMLAQANQQPQAVLQLLR